ncbi:hypothetical protein HIM_01708 [Hirsutella minnesotensis 3608]|nr:hypothetical protein HIM_01708 [Hirsutella minnesotensis 3608]
MTEAARFMAGCSHSPASTGTSSASGTSASTTTSTSDTSISIGTGQMPSSVMSAACAAKSGESSRPKAPAAPALAPAPGGAGPLPTSSSTTTATTGTTSAAVTAIAAAAKPDSSIWTRARDGGDNAHNNNHAPSFPTTPLNLHSRGLVHHHASSAPVSAADDHDRRWPRGSPASSSLFPLQHSDEQQQQQQDSSCSPPLAAANPDPAPRKGPSAPVGLVQHNGSQAAVDGQTPHPGREASASSVAPSSADYPTTSPTDADPSAQRPSPTSEPHSFDADGSSSSSSPLSSSPPSPTSPSDRLSPESDSSKPWPHWVSASSSHNPGAWDSSRPPPSLSTRRRRLVEATAAHNGPFPRVSTATDLAQGPRELILPKRLSQSSTSDDSPHSSPCRPPISYKPPVKSNGPRRGVSEPVRVPPIRAFRSSSSRRSYPLDTFRSRSYQFEDMSDEPTLRALEGRDDDDTSVVASNHPNAHHQNSANDDTGDVFLKIAREESSHGARGDVAQDKAHNSIYRSHHSMHRRPLSTAVIGYHTTSPPRLNRRLSDHRDRARLGDVDDDQATEVSRAPSYRFLSRDKAASAHPGEDGQTSRAKISSGNLRPSPMASRSLQVAFQEAAASDNSSYARRRASITDGNRSPLTSGRSSAFRGSGVVTGHTKTYSSSPLVREADSFRRSSPEQTHGIEGNESATSTTAPSTVWDELDDLKSRIHRLELTGKLPSSSGTATSRHSDERPATATTVGTTISLSPHRQGTRPPEVQTNGTQKEAHQILSSALAKSKPFISPEVYRALESAAHDAMGLSTMMGCPGQPGPISSGASTIGSGSNVTDRQLRRKADSVCRSLTELCVALGEEAAAQPRSAQTVQAAPVQFDGPATPTVPKSFSGLPVPRRASIAVETGLLPKSNSSPRALSRLEERRNSLLNGTALPTPRSNGFNPSTPGDSSITRRSSLMVGRTRRTAADETEDGRNTSLLRTRRTGPEEHEEGRRTSLLMRHRRGTVGEDYDESRFRAPSRSHTEANPTRHQGCDHPTEIQSSPLDTVARSASGLFGRRLVSSNFHSSRLAAPSNSSPAPPRRYLERTLPDQDATVIRPSEEHVSRAPPLSNGISHLRTTSLSVKRHSRDSMASAVSPASATSVYR